MFEILLSMLQRFLSLIRLSSRPVITVSTTPASIICEETGKSTSLHQILDSCPSLIGKQAYYTPTLGLNNGHLATMYSSVAALNYHHLQYSRHLLRVPDGGTISLDFTPPITPEQPIDDRPILVVLHGLTGGSHENYVRDILNRATGAESAMGWRGVVVNFRGCAFTEISGREDAPKQLYHGGWTNDLRCALSFLSHYAPNAPLHGTGFSLGANILARYLGEEGDATPLKSACSMGTPFDFEEGNNYLNDGTFLRKIYSRAMAKNLRTLLRRHWTTFSLDQRLDESTIFNDPKQTLMQFDILVTAVLGGFADIHAYYAYASSKPYLKHIRIPFLGISAIDDPIAPSSSIPYAAVDENPWVIFATTKDGGHLGWWEGPFWRIRRWVSKPATEFMRAVETANPGATRPAKGTLPKSTGVVGFVKEGVVVRVVGEETTGWEYMGECTVDEEKGGEGMTKGL